MNVETTLEQELQAELSRLKRAVDYIEQAKETVQEVQQINKDNQLKYEALLESNESLKSEMSKQISPTDEKFEKLVDEMSKLTDIINAQQKEIRHNQTWLETLSAHIQEIQQVNKDNETRYEEALKLNETLRSKMTKQTSSTDKKFEGLVDEMNNLAKQVDELQNKNEQQASLKWYQRLFR